MHLIIILGLYKQEYKTMKPKLACMFVQYTDCNKLAIVGYETMHFLGSVFTGSTVAGSGSGLVA